MLFKPCDFYHFVRLFSIKIINNNNVFDFTLQIDIIGLSGKLNYFSRFCFMNLLKWGMMEPKIASTPISL